MVAVSSNSTRPKRRAQWWLAVLLSVGLITAFSDTDCAAYAPIARTAFSPKISHYAFAFVDTDIALVADEVLSHTLGVSYSIDPGVAAKVSFRLDRQLTPVQLLEAFEASLEASDIVMVREGDSFVLKARSKAKAVAGLRQGDGGARGVGFETATVTLSYARPSEVAKTIQAMSGADPLVFADDKQGSLVLSGSGRQLQDLVALAKTFDRSGLEGSKIRYFELAAAPAETVAAELSKILSAAEFSGASVVPLQRLNGVIVFARTSQTLDQLASWIIRLDVPSKESGTTLYVYRPRNVTAEALGSTLTSVVNGASSTSGATSGASTTGSTAGNSQGRTALSATTEPTSREGGLDGDVTRVGVDKESNTLLIFSTPSRWVQIQRVLNEIDRPARQVMIEASILEVTLTDNTSLGVDWSLVDSHGKLGVSSINSATGLISQQSPGFSIAYLGGDIKLAINALGEQGHVEVVSAPKVLALDNHPARLDVGDQVPIVTQTGQSTIGSNSPVINSVDYRSTGVILRVTPRINGDTRINLDIEQEVSAVSQTTTSAINSPTIQQRKIATSMVVDDGGLIAIGGLITSGRQQSDTGFPIVKDIPIFGNLFKTSHLSHNRTELIVLLTAKVLSDAASSQRVTHEVLGEMQELERRGLLSH